MIVWLVVEARQNLLAFLVTALCKVPTRCVGKQEESNGGDESRNRLKGDRKPLDCLSAVTSNCSRRLIPKRFDRICE